MKMKFVLLLFIVWFLGIFVGAVTHEKDLSRNFHRDGNAHAWFYPINVEDLK